MLENMNREKDYEHCIILFFIVEIHFVKNKKTSLPKILTFYWVVGVKILV